MRFFIKLAVLAVAIVLIAVALVNRAGDAPAPDSPDGPRVVVIGVDALDWGRFERLAADGRLPNMERLREAGASGELRSIPPFVSPTVWTSIATGKTGEKHGVGGFTTYGVRGSDALKLISSDMIKCRTLWEILHSAGRSSGVVGWLVTYPPVPVTTYTVTSRSIMAISHDPTDALPEGVGADVAVGVHPEALWNELAGVAIRPSDIPENDVLALMGPTDGLSPELLSGTEKMLSARLAADRTTVAVAAKLMDAHTTDLTAIYLNGCDIVSHFFWRYWEPESWTRDTLSGEAVAALGPVIDNYYVVVDDMVGEILRHADENTVVMICSDHGFAGHRGHPGFHAEDAGDMAFGVEMHRQEGTILMCGPGVREGSTIGGATVLDVAPTVLALFGLPVGRDMDGRPLTGALDQSFLDGHPVSYVDTYEVGDRIQAGGSTESPVDDEIKELLRSLGYIN